MYIMILVFTVIQKVCAQFFIVVYTHTLAQQNSSNDLQLITNQTILQELDKISSFAARRCYTNLTNVTRYQLIGFSDARMSSYCAVFNLRSENSKNEVDLYFVCPKLRVTPLKGLTIHHLKPLGSLLLSKLIVRVSCELNISLEKLFVYSVGQPSLRIRRNHQLVTEFAIFKN